MATFKGTATEKNLGSLVHSRVCVFRANWFFYGYHFALDYRFTYIQHLNIRIVFWRLSELRYHNHNTKKKPLKIAKNRKKLQLWRWKKMYGTGSSRYQGNWSVNMMADFCWTLKREMPRENVGNEKGTRCVGHLKTKESDTNEEQFEIHDLPSFYIYYFLRFCIDLWMFEIIRFCTCIPCIKIYNTRNIHIIVFNKFFKNFYYCNFLQFFSVFAIYSNFGGLMGQINFRFRFSGSNYMKIIYSIQAYQIFFISITAVFRNLLKFWRVNGPNKL